jgi:hypothetical protein
VARFLEELSAPPRVHPLGDVRDPARSFLSVQPASVALSALRPAAGGRLEARLLNLESRSLEARLTGVENPRRRRLDGRPLTGRLQPGRLRLRPAELLTLEGDLEQR